MEELHYFQHDGKEGLLLPAKVESLRVLKGWLCSISRALKLDNSVEISLLIACEEVFTNIASYSYPGLVEAGSVKISVGFHGGKNELSLIFRDNGIPFNPLEDAKEAELDMPLEERKIGGLGILIVKNLMDGLQYRRENGANILTLTMHLDAKL